VRRAFTQQLAELEHRIIDDLTGAADPLSTVAAAVRGANGKRAMEIADEARKLRASSTRILADLVTVSALQTPVASDLRLVMAMIEMAHRAALIANQFELISQQLADDDPSIHDRDEIGEKLSQMSALASAELIKASTAFRARDSQLARELDRDDDAIDRLNREIFEAAARAELSDQQRAQCLRQVLIARSLERIGDNAVDIAEQAAFLVTAELIEFSDASQPRAQPGR
jgi:phosphate transport system protein